MFFKAGYGKINLANKSSKQGQKRVVVMQDFEAVEAVEIVEVIEVVGTLLKDAGVSVKSVNCTNQPDQFVVELGAQPGSWAHVEQQLLDADFALVGWGNGTGYRCLVRDIAYVVEKRLHNV